MAYAGDLKSPVLYRTCGFDSRPGHQNFLLEISPNERMYGKTPGEEQLEIRENPFLDCGNMGRTNPYTALLHV